MVQAKRGFTLIELLVVIAIIALLLSILMPSLRHARESGQRMHCMANLRSLTIAQQMYANDHSGRVPSGNTEGPYGWVNHLSRGGNLAYYNIENDPELKKEQERAIKQGLLWPYASGNLDIYLCPTSRQGQARSYSMPDSFAYDLPGLLNINGADKSMLIKKLSSVKNPSARMLFIDEGWATPVTWSIMYDSPQWWDPVPERHSSGTTLAFIDGHTKYWKWEDERTRKFAQDVEDLINPNDASFWRRVEPGNEDIERLVTAVWGRIGWDKGGRRSR